MIVTSLLLYGLLIVLNILFIRWILKHRAHRRTLSAIPSPDFLPIIGFMWNFMHVPVKDRTRWFHDLCMKFKNGMILIWIGTEPKVFINHAKYAEWILSSNTLITKAKSYVVLRPWLGNGLVMTTGAYWSRHRRLITPAFYFNILDDYAEIMRRKSLIFLECIEEKYKKDPTAPMNMYDMCINFTLDTLCEAAMGTNIDCQRKPDNTYYRALHSFSELAWERIVNFWERPDFIYFRTPRGKEALRNVKLMHDFSAKIISRKIKEREERRKAGKANEVEVDEFGQRKRKCFLDLLFDESEKSDNPLSFTELREETDTFMFGGHDTTAVATACTLFALGNEPEIQDRVHAEMKEVFGDQTEIATPSQLNELKYLDRVIKEALRFYPAGSTIGRTTDKDYTIDDIFIPKDTAMILNIYQLHHNPRVWENPEKFDPDRFLPENTHGRNPYAYVPFSAGPRNCIGFKFAQVEMKIVLTELLRKWKVRSVLKTHELNLVQHFILRPYDEKIEIYMTPVDS